MHEDFIYAFAVHNEELENAKLHISSTCKRTFEISRLSKWPKPWLELESTLESEECLPATRKIREPLPSPTPLIPLSLRMDPINPLFTRPASFLLPKSPKWAPVEGLPLTQLNAICATVGFGSVECGRASPVVSCTRRGG